MCSLKYPEIKPVGSVPPKGAVSKGCSAARCFVPNNAILRCSRLLAHNGLASIHSLSRRHL